MGRIKYVLLLFILGTAFAHTGEKIPYAVWDKSCFKIYEDAYVYAPMKDGKPDYTKVGIYGMELPEKCMHFEIKKIKDGIIQ